MDRRTFFGTLAGGAAALSVGKVSFAQNTSEVRIGFLAATSGPAAFLGISERNVFELMVNQYNAAGGIGGRKVVPFIYDTEGSSTVAAQQLRRVIDSDKVDVVIGPSTTGEALVMRTIAEESKIPMIAMTGTESIVVPPTPYVFKTAPTDRQVSLHMLQFAKSKGWNNIGIITSADGFGQAGATYLKENAEKFGMKIDLAEEFGPRDTDMTPQILRLRRANIQALMIWSVNPGPTIILRNAEAAGFKTPIINSFGAASPALLEQAGKSAEGTYVSTMRLLIPDQLPESDPLREVVSNIAKLYREQVKQPVTTFVGNAHDAVKLMELAVKKINGGLYCRIRSCFPAQ